MLIPDMGVNKILDNVLTTVCEDYALRSWSVFHEKDGSISLRIRFDASDRGRGEPNRDAVYKRKSPAQAARDKLRSDRWRSTKPNREHHDPQPAPTQEVSDHADTTELPLNHYSCTRVMTRSMSKQTHVTDTPEITRCVQEVDISDTLDLTLQNLDPLLQTFSIFPTSHTSSQSLSGSITPNSRSDIMDMEYTPTVNTFDELQSPTMDPIHCDNDTVDEPGVTISCSSSHSSDIPNMEEIRESTPSEHLDITTMMNIVRDAFRDVLSPPGEQT